MDFHQLQSDMVMVYIDQSNHSQQMGFFKIVLLISVPLSGMTYAAFSLGKQLPKATRKFGNYIGLSYIYFKTILKVLKPEDQIPYEMIEIARRTSQQSQALKRQLKNTIKKAKEDIQKKQDETIKNFESSDQFKKVTPANIQPNSEQKGSEKMPEVSGSQSIREILVLRQRLIEKKKLKNKSRSFFEKI